MFRREIKPILLLLLGAFVILYFTNHAKLQEKPIPDSLAITANFEGKEIVPNQQIEITLNRALTGDEGGLAFMLGETDLTALFVVENKNLSYTPKFALFPVGENKLAVYLVKPDGNWKKLKEFTLRVSEKNAVKTDDAETAKKTENKAESADKQNSVKSASKTKFEFTPNLSLNVKGESTVLFFPQNSRPERISFTDTAGQGSLQLNVENNGWKFNNQFDLAGSSRKNDALRFNELGVRAPSIDLSSYQISFEKGRFKAKLGHVSFGTQKHLINGFSSRGIVLTIPISRQNELSLTALNGTSIVGFDNFLGITRAKHQILAAAFAREFFKERPGGLRLEFTLMHGSLLPVTGVNQRAVTDAEKSFGGAIHLFFKDKKERFRFEGGFTRSRFTNPPDPSLEQGQKVTPIRPATRNARFAEISYDFLKDFKITANRKLKLTGTFRHEEIQPLFRSVVASTQADRRQNQFEVTASLGDINFTYGNLRDRDNLNRIPSILETLDRRHNLTLSIPLGTLFNQAKPKKWLPNVGYSYDHIHQFAAFIPTNGDFRDPSQIPDQDNFLQNFNAEWTFSQKFRVGYKYNHSFQDNKQPGRELADFLNTSNSVTVGTQFSQNFDLNFDVSREEAKNFEQPRIDGTFRFNTNLTWRNALLKNLTFNTDFSTTFAGDRANTNDSRNSAFDAQLAYKFEFGKEKFKKMSAQVFVRYADTYGKQIDHIFLLNNFNKNQAFNMGLTFNFF